VNGVLYPVWSDNSNSTGDNPDGTLSKLDVYTAKVTLSNLPPPPPPPPARASQIYAVGADAGGGPEVKVYNAQTNKLVLDFYAYDPRFTGGVRVAVGDVFGTGTDDIITAPGPGGGPDIRVFDGKTGKLLDDFFAYDPRFPGGAFVATGDVNGIGHAEIITGAGAGGGPNVRVFNAAHGNAMLGNFYAYNAAFSGGVHVAAGDLNGTGVDQIITGAGPGGGPNVRVFDGVGNMESGTVGNFLAFDPNFVGGVFVAAGRFNGSNHADIIAGAGPGGAPEVRVFDGQTGAQVSTFRIGPDAATLFNADSDAFRAGVRVAAFDPTGTGNALILTGFGPPAQPLVQTFNITGAQQLAFEAFNTAFLGGVYVGGA
jgi:hypothetical protein